MMKVFIADDSPIVVERLADLLQQIRGLELIGHAGDVPEAANLIQKLSPDVVILDLQMPKGSGLDVLRVVKRTSPQTCVIVFTNFPYPQYRKRCLEAGANFFLDKSSDFDKIPTIFGQLIEQSLVDSHSHSHP